jgi:formate-dependent nitrite reductase cytochrome c552 subunit
VKHARPVVAEACTTCHMPAVRAGEHLTFANHRIAIY